MATVDIPTGVQMKQRQSERDEAEEEEEGRRHHWWGAVMSLEANEGVELLKEQQKKYSIILNLHHLFNFHP